MGKKILKKTPKIKKDKDDLLEIRLGETHLKVSKDIETINTVKLVLAVYEDELLRNEPKVPEEYARSKDISEEDKGKTEIEIPEVPEEKPDVIPTSCPLCNSKIKQGKSKVVGDKITQVFKCKKNRVFRKKCNFIRECSFQI